MANAKTLDDLAKQVIDSQAGLMSVDDLKVFFDDVPPAPNPINQTAVEPAPAPAPPASTVTPTTPVEPVVSQPNVLEFVPEKFNDGNTVTSVQKLTKSYGELEAELRKEREEKANLNNMLQNLSNQPVPEPTFQPTIPQAIDDVDDVEDSMFFDKPKEATTRVSERISKKVASEVAASMLIAYHNALTEASKRIQFVEAFKAQHPDFGKYREDMAAILRARPDLDKNAQNLPMVYEMAKARYTARLNSMRQELGVAPAPSDTPPAPAPTQLTEAELIEKAKAAILAEIGRRKAASGITGGVPPTSPQVRATPTVTEVPKTAEDQIFDEMMGSGPNRLTLNL